MNKKKTRSMSGLIGAMLALVAGVAWAVGFAVLWQNTGAREEAWNLGIFLGRFHILILHFPIAFLLLAFLLEFFGALHRRSRLASFVLPLMWFGALGAAVASVSGYLYMAGERIEGATMQLHLWTGLAVCAFAFVVLVLKHLRVDRGICLAVMALTCALLGVSSHAGGKMVHKTAGNEDFLLEYAPDWVRSWTGGAPEVGPLPSEKDINTLVVYREVIQPVLDAKCIGCHGVDKIQGKLRMDSFEQLALGGEAGASFIPGDPEKSEIHRRVTLDPDAKGFMPPDKEQALMPEEIAVLAWWIEKGASPTLTVAAAEPDEAMFATLETLVMGEGFVGGPIVPWGDLDPDEQARRLEQVQASAGEIGFTLSPLSAADDRLSLDVSSCAASFGDAELAVLEPVASHIAWADFARSQITDAGMAVIGRMIELERLNLGNTMVSDTGLRKMSRLQKLDYLNLYGTGVTDAGLPLLRELHNLRKLHLWQTKVTPSGKRDFERAVNLEIEIGSDGE